LVFFGEQRLNSIHPHESPKVMTVPLIILSILSVFGGFINIPSLFGGNADFSAFLKSNVISSITEEMSHTTEIGLIILSLALLILVIFFAYRTYVKKAMIPLADEAPKSFFSKLIYNKFYLDEIYSFLFEKPLGYLSTFLFNKVENTLIDPAVDGIGTATSRLGGLVRKLQQGNMSFYLFAMVAGIILFIVFILIV
ncbi:MAG: NADH-quinone oxidoreductase subunit L, partial [Bacteroidota bacterium]